jgi:hypothetical protein
VPPADKLKIRQGFDKQQKLLRENGPVPFRHFKHSFLAVVINVDRPDLLIQLLSRIDQLGIEP